MSIDPDILNLLSPFIDIYINQPKISCLCQRVISNGKFENLIFYFNESHFYFCNPKEIQKTLIKYDVFSLTKIYSETNVIGLFFHDFSIYFTTELYRTILDCIVSYVQNVFKSCETPEVFIETFDFSFFSPSPYASEMRFKAKCFIKGLIIPQDIISSFHSFLAKKPHSISTSDFDTSPELLELLFESISVEPCITNAFVKFEKLPSLGTFISLNNTIQVLEIEGPFPEDIQSLEKAFEINKTSQIRNISIKKGKISKAQLRSIARIIKLSKIQCLKMSGSLNSDSRMSFHTIFQKANVFQNLISLSLDNTQNLGINQILRMSINLQKLSIANCGIQLSLFFNSLALLPQSKLEFINLSGNQAEKPINDTMVLPSSIREIKASNIFFSNDNFIRFLRIMTTVSISLDVSHTIMDNERWTWCLSSLEDLDPKLMLRIVWEDNPIDSNFFAFIDKAVSLSELKIDGCYLNENSITLGALSNFILYNSTIESLSIRGTRKNTFGSKTLKYIFRSLRFNSSVKKLDISENPLSNETKEALKTLLLSNQIISTLDIHNCGFDSFQELKEFICNFLERGKPLKMNLLPQNRLKFVDEELQVLQTLTSFVEEGNPQIEIPKGQCDIPEIPKQLMNFNKQNVEIHFSEKATIDSGNEKLFIIQTTLPEIDDSMYEGKFENECSLKHLLSQINLR